MIVDNTTVPSPCTKEAHMKPDIIPGFPDPSYEQVELFQSNNHRVPDGIIGPKTRSAIWREEGDDMYTHLATCEVKRGAAGESEKYCEEYLRARGSLELKPEHMQTVMTFLASEWRTGYDYLSTQDSVTFGSRRYAASTLRKFIEVNRDGFRGYFGSYGTMLLCDKLKDAPNNAWPLNDPAIRFGFIEAAQDRKIWARQIEDTLSDIHRVLKRERWTHGRMITLACRAANSGAAFIHGLPNRESKAYEALVDRYTKAGKGRRVKRIEMAIPNGTVWR